MVNKTWEKIENHAHSFSTVTIGTKSVFRSITDNQGLLTFCCLIVVLMFLLVLSMRQMSRYCLCSSTFGHSYCSVRAPQRLPIILPRRGRFLALSLPTCLTPTAAWPTAIDCWMLTIWDGKDT